MNEHSFISLQMPKNQPSKGPVYRLWLPVDCYECGIYKSIPCLYTAVWRLIKVLPPDLRGVNTLLQMLCLGPTDRDVIENILYQLEKDGKISKVFGEHWQVQADSEENEDDDMQTLGYMFAEPVSGHVFPFFRNSQKPMKVIKPNADDKFIHFHPASKRVLPSNYQFNQAYQTYIKFCSKQESIVPKQEQAPETAPAPFEQPFDQLAEDNLQGSWSLKLLPGKAPTRLYIPLQLEISVFYPERWHVTSPFWADTPKALSNLFLRPEIYIGAASTPADKDMPASQYLASETNQYVQGLTAPELVAKLSPEERIRQLVPHYYLFTPNQMKEMIRGFLADKDHEVQLSRFIKVVENLFNRLHETAEVLNSPFRYKLADSLDSSKVQAILTHYDLTEFSSLEIFKDPQLLANIIKRKGKNHGNSLIQKMAVLLVLGYEGQASEEITHFLDGLSPAYFGIIDRIRFIRNKDGHAGQTNPDAEGVTEYKEEYWTECVKEKKVFVVMDKILQSFEGKESI